MRRLCKNLQVCKCMNFGVRAIRVFRVQITMSLPQVKVMFIFSDTSFTGDVLVFKDMAGAFYAVFFGLAFSLIMLLVELTWAAYKDHKQGQVGYIRNE